MPAGVSKQKPILFTDGLKTFLSLNAPIHPDIAVSNAVLSNWMLYKARTYQST